MADDNATSGSHGARSPGGERRTAVPSGAGEAGVGGVGPMLRAAREAAGLSEDAVAQQLKLAPRQVRAIEEDDYARLPGRTFVRGFVRNYARLVHLDADAIVAALPAGEATSPLERLTYTPSSRPMGEIPAESSRRAGGGAARWMIPLVLLAVVAVAAYYEFSRPPALSPAPPDGVMPPPAPGTAPPAAPATAPLPNPLEAPKAESPSTSQSAGVETAAPAKAAELSTVAPSVVAQASANASMPAASTSDPTASVATAAGAPLVLTFSGASWVQIKDASGAEIVSQTAASGATIPVGGKAPFAVVIGNADHVRLQYRGQPIDLGPHTYHNVARLTLK
jgi:cytoskeleton protein RodZ